MKTALTIALALVLTGCANSPKFLENRLACTADGTELYTVSKWGPFGIGTQIAQADAAKVCAK